MTRKIIRMRGQSQSWGSGSATVATTVALLSSTSALRPPPVFRGESSRLGHRVGQPPPPPSSLSSSWSSERYRRASSKMLSSAPPPDSSHAVKWENLDLGIAATSTIFGGSTEESPVDDDDDDDDDNDDDDNDDRGGRRRDDPRSRERGGQWRNPSSLGTFPGYSAYEHFLDRALALSGNRGGAAASDKNGKSSLHLHLPSDEERHDSRVDQRSERASFGTFDAHDVDGFRRGNSSDRVRRKLNGLPEFRPIRISFDTHNLSSMSSSHMEEIHMIENVILPAIVDTWAKVLSVTPIQSTIQLNDGVCGKDIIIPDNYAANGANETDLLVFVAGFPSDTGGCVPGRLGSAIPCLLNRITDRPVVGSVFFCLDTVRSEVEAGKMDEAGLKEFASHEFGHVLGFSSLLYPFYRDGTTSDLRPRTPNKEERAVQCLDGQIRSVMLPDESVLTAGLSSTGMRHFDIVTPAVRQVARNQFDCQTLPGARLENQPTNSMDCFGSHWDERLFYTELMGAKFNTNNILSPLTLALMEDTGWYHVNYSHSDISPFGHRAGCEFVTGNCLIGGNVPDYAKGSFCDLPMFVDEDNRLANYWMCSPSHTHVAQCDLVDHRVFVEEFQNPPPVNITDAYFSLALGNLDAGDRADNATAENSTSIAEEGMMMGPFAFFEADFCPIAHLRQSDCRDASNLPSVSGEEFDPSSLCFDASLPSQFNGLDDPYAICLRSHCNESTGKLEVHVSEQVLVCDYDGQRLPHPGLEEDDEIICPKLAQACPHLICPHNCRGRGVCRHGADAIKCDCFDPNDQSPSCENTPYEAYLLQIPSTNSTDMETTGPSQEPSVLISSEAEGDQNNLIADEPTLAPTRDRTTLAPARVPSENSSISPTEASSFSGKNSSMQEENIEHNLDESVGENWTVAVLPDPLSIATTKVHDRDRDRFTYALVMVGLLVLLSAISLYTCSHKRRMQNSKSIILNEEDSDEDSTESIVINNPLR